MPSAVRAAAIRWFRIWMGAWFLFLVSLLLTTRGAVLPAPILGPSLALQAALLALAFWLLAGLERGRRVVGATALVGLFALAGVVAAVLVASQGLRHESPALLVAIHTTFFGVTVRTLVALVRLLGRGPARSR